MNGIGVSNLPNEQYRHVLNNGISYNIMILGEEGLGKTSFINMILEQDIMPKTGSIKVDMTILERDFKVNLSVTEINTEDDIDAVEIIKNGFIKYNNLESQHRIFEDCRTHVCLYFFEPSGIHIKPKDLNLMKKISEWTNLIPIVGRGDSYTNVEKKLIRDNIGCVFEACFKCDTIVEYPLFIISNKMREYEWGTVYTFDQEISDTAKLKKILITNNLTDLIDETGSFYHKYKNKNLVTEIIKNFCANESEKELGKSFLKEIENNE
ncbi:Cell division control protein 3 [Dictyocoela muelleri]|nr:Cell division control protein 3 [Dictyocoela muelleri]